MTKNENKNISWEEVVKFAKLEAADTPVSGSVLENKVVKLFKDADCMLSAKVCMDTLGEKHQKWYSDKLWNLAQKGVLVCKQRGWYQYVRKD